jgi:integrase/recombinase XerD
MGMRVAEATLSSRAQSERGLARNIYHIGKEAKNGRERDVNMSPAVRQMMERRLTETERGNKLFVQTNEMSHRAINRIESFLAKHREKAETLEGRQLRTWTNKHTGKVHVNELTMHGLRYNYIQDRVQQELDKGAKDIGRAANIVTKEVGHNRSDVIYIYLGGK